MKGKEGKMMDKGHSHEEAMMMDTGGMMGAMGPKKEHMMKMNLKSGVHSKKNMMPKT